MLIVDAGPLFAAASTGDRNHRRCTELLMSHSGPFLVPALVVAEVSYLLVDRIGPHAELAFARSIAAGELIIEPVLEAEWERIAELTQQYLDLPLGIVDASLVVLAERHHATVVASLDHRHFSVVQPRHAVHFTLVP